MFCYINLSLFLYKTTNLIKTEHSGYKKLQGDTMVRGVIVKINEQRGATGGQLSGTVKREDTGAVIPFKTSLSGMSNIGEGDWVSGTVGVGKRMMTNVKFAQRGMRSGVAGRTRKQ